MNSTIAEKTSPVMKARGLAKLTSVPQSSRSMQVVDQLTDLILDGEFQPDELLPPERDLAARLGVSRNSLREATKVLQSRGLLSIRQGTGTIVSTPGSEPMQHALSHALHGQTDAMHKLMEVRLSVEVEIAALAANRATPDQLAKLRSIVDEMLQSLNDLDRFAELDMTFHLTLAEATQNNLFSLVLDAFTSLSQQVRLGFLASGFPARDSHQEHLNIFLAVQAHDSVLAAKLMKQHLQNADAGIEEFFGDGDHK